MGADHSTLGSATLNQKSSIFFPRFKAATSHLKHHETMTGAIPARRRPEALGVPAGAISAHCPTEDLCPSMYSSPSETPILWAF
jgi:hypothetical protein